MEIDLNYYVNSPEAAKRLQIDPATVPRLIYSAGLPAIKLGHNWYIKKDDLESFARTYRKLNRPPPIRALPIDLNRYVKVIEASQRLGINRGSLRKMIYRGELPAIKVRNTWLIEKDKFEAFVKSYVKKKRQSRTYVSLKEKIDLSKYAKVNEAAKWLGMHPGNVRKMIYRGELPAIRVGNAWSIKRESIVENMPCVDLSNYVKTTEVSQQLGVHYTTVERLIRRGQLPAERVRGIWFIRKDKVEAAARIVSKDGVLVRS